MPIEPPPDDRSDHQRGPLPPQAARWSWLGMLAIATACWGAVAGTHFYLPWSLTMMWVFALLPLGAAWLGAITTSVVIVVALIRRVGAPAAIGAAVASVVLAAGVLVTDWRAVYAHVWFASHEAGFTTAQQLARAGALGRIDGWDYYGVELPPALRTLSVNGRIASIGAAGGEPVLFVPAYIGIPDDGFGFAHLSGPPDTMLDGYGDPVEPRIDLGGGWWWVD